jgi:hypothetical protein
MLCGAAAPKGYCHTLIVGDQTNETLVGLHFPPTTLDRAGPEKCLSGGCRVFIVADLDAKHKDWNSRLISVLRSCVFTDAASPGWSTGCS